MEPVLELSSTIFDLALADDSDADSNVEPHLGDMLMLQKASDVCSSALQNAGMVPQNTDQRVLNWLQQFQVVDVFENGDICLARDSVAHGLAISMDVLERETRDNSTTLEIQEDLKILGWSLVDDFRSASIANKNAFADNPSTYYDLLMNFAEILCDYEDDDMFHHKQSEPYYKTVEAAVINHPDKLEFIPKYKSAPFYAELQQFLSGSPGKSDPRDGFVQKPRLAGQVFFFAVKGMVL